MLLQALLSSHWQKWIWFLLNIKHTQAHLIIAQLLGIEVSFNLGVDHKKNASFKNIKSMEMLVNKGKNVHTCRWQELAGGGK